MLTKELWSITVDYSLSVHFQISKTNNYICMCVCVGVCVCVSVCMCVCDLENSGIQSLNTAAKVHHGV